jgi:hypothetical protein
MAGNYSNKVQSDNKHLANQTSARFVHIDGAQALVTVEPATSGCRLLRVINNSKGLALNIRTGSRVIGTLATTTIEGTYSYGVYVPNGIQVDVSGTGSATLVFAD